AAIQAYQRDATTTQRTALDATLRSDDATKAADSEAIAIASEQGPLTGKVDTAAWWAQMTRIVDAQRDVQRSLGADISGRADQLRSSATTTLAVYIGFALLALLVLIGLVLASLRSIVRPLAALAAEADDVASRRLPDLISAWHRATDTEPEAPQQVSTPSGAGAEIVSVAQAFDRVQRTAYELASEQALLRRNTTESLA
ncbi:nitrate- and nitrite sensing domain-containing protein, partial [Nocardia gipuzkoensis]